MANNVRHVLFYDSGDLSLAAEHFPAHQARYQEFMRSGVLLTLGPFSDRGGSMAIFTTLEAAEEFASADPFVLNGVVSGWQIREWNAVTPLYLHFRGRQDTEPLPRTLARAAGRTSPQMLLEVFCWHPGEAAACRDL